MSFPLPKSSITLTFPQPLTSTNLILSPRTSASNLAIANNNANDQNEAYEATNTEIEINVFLAVLGDIRSVGPPDHFDAVDKVIRAYFGAQEELFAAYYEHFLHLGNTLGGTVVLTEGEVAWATVSLMWWKFCGGVEELFVGEPCPADVFREECREHMGRPDEGWLLYVARRVRREEEEEEEDGMD